MCEMFFLLWWNKHQEMDLNVYMRLYALCAMNPTALYGTFARDAAHFTSLEDAGLNLFPPTSDRM